MHVGYQSRDIDKAEVAFSKCSVDARYPDQIAIRSGLVWIGPKLSRVFLCANAIVTSGDSPNSCVRVSLCGVRLV